MPNSDWVKRKEPLNHCLDRIGFLGYTLNQDKFSLSVLNSIRTKMTRITPYWGSRGGATTLVIMGAGYPDIFQDDGTLTSIKLIDVDNPQSQYDCDLDIQQSTRVALSCFTRPMPEGEYKFMITLGGQSVQICTAWHCRFRTITFKSLDLHNWQYKKELMTNGIFVFNSRTPTISSITPTAALPGTVLDVEGRIFTDLYASTNAITTNGRKVRIKKAFAGAGILCQLKNSTTDKLYGLSLNSETSTYGKMKCVPEGTSVENKFVSYIVNGEYGSVKEYCQTLSKVISVSPMTGSTEGGLTLTINGRYFDESKFTQKAQETEASDMNYWTGESRNFADLPQVLSFTSANSGYNVIHLDETYFSNRSHDNYVSLMTGHFVPPHSGSWSFHIRADDGAILYLSTDMDPANKVKVAECPSYASTFYKYPKDQNSDMITLEKEKSYFMQIVHREGSGQEALYAAAAYYGTKFLSSQTANAIQEKQVIQLTTKVVWETQNVTFTTSPMVTIHEVQEVTVNADGQFKLGIYDVYTKPLRLVLSDSDVRNALLSIPVFDNSDDITVSSTSVAADEKKYTITYVSNRGDWPDMTVLKIDGNTFTKTVSETTQGRGNGSVVSLLFDGVPSPLFDPTGSASHVSNAIKKLFSVRCPSFLNNPPRSAKFFDYESSKPSYTKGIRVADIEPFCGSWSAQNVQILYDKEDTKGVLMSDYKHVEYTFKDEQSEDISKSKVFPHNLNYDANNKEK
ncbi:hypothetical protein KUTeg_009109 [Tegillarca granosa]|uniref:PA14 domain-containing protein n=1 Tax=Tegillarca granosa TaxID=220873 RepID=A0ABQ9F7J7_TEGGR|nr:hypothetical protein KUTeg_009109 [Tegillarca granosa]